MDDPPSPLQGHELLKTWRLERGLSMSAVARLVGVSVPSVLDWERARKRPTDEYREALELLAKIPRGIWRAPAEQAVVDRVRERLAADPPEATAATEAA